MCEIAIRVENLSKSYDIGLLKTQYHTLRDVLVDSFKSAFRRNSPGSGGDSSFWALQDVSFEVLRGEAVGLIGRNGAGKSTLLKILSRITEPTKGGAEIRGRVSSLLEVGTGFHGELTGRENIFLNGAILGMKKAEIERKFDEIVDFSGVGKFIDTPVKRYSSGMHVRLAFAVAAHLEPEILIVDEVLAVGDVEFQKKCLGKMEDVTRQGRTVLFVSHNMAAIANLCSRALQFTSGRLVRDGSSTEVVSTYLQEATTHSDIPIGERTDRKGNQRLRFLDFTFLNDRDEPILHAVAGQGLRIALKYTSENGQCLKNVHVAMQINGRFGEHLFNLPSNASSQDFDLIPAQGVLICDIPVVPLQPGAYNMNFYSTVEMELADWIVNAATLEVFTGDFFGTGRLPSIEQGSFLVKHSWRVAPRVEEDVYASRTY